MFTLSFKNEAEFSITLKNLDFEFVGLLATNTDFFQAVCKEKYYMYAEYDRIKFDKYTFLVVKNNKKVIEMILLNKE